MLMSWLKREIIAPVSDSCGTGFICEKLPATKLHMAVCQYIYSD